MRAGVFAVVGLAACGAPADERAAADPPTFWRDAEPVLAQHCVRCHDGAGIGPGDFRDPATAQGLAELMIQRIDAGEMPPPTSDPGCRDYQDSAGFAMEPAGRDVLAAWSAAGAPEGDPATAVQVTAPAVHLAAPDHVLSTAAPYAPDFVDGNEYRCFVLDWDEANDLFLTGFEFEPDTVAMSHHAVLYLDPSGQAGGNVTDAATQSWRCEASPDSSWYYLHSWAPGSAPIQMAPATGLKIPGGSSVVVQMHYFDGRDGAVPDEPRYALTTTDSVTTEVYYGPVGPTDFVIPPGDPAYTDSDSYSLRDIVDLPLTFTIWGGSAHMHVLGEAYDVRYRHEDGTETCLLSGDYDFSNQLTYWFQEPAVIASDGGTLDVSCTWDNSVSNPDRIHANPQETRWGENTDEEMCYAFLYFSVGL
jgi:hypothetical protein